MYPASFDYYRPKTVAEAVKLLGQNKNARVLAGGHSLLPQMKLRVATPSALVDIGRVKGLSDVKATKTALKVGAMATNTKQVGSGMTDAFTQSIQTDQPPEIDGMEGYRSLAVILTAMESAAAGKALPISGR